MWSACSLPPSATANYTSRDMRGTSSPAPPRGLAAPAAPALLQGGFSPPAPPESGGREPSQTPKVPSPPTPPCPPWLRRSATENATALIAPSASAPKAEAGRCAHDAPKGIVHTTRRNATYPAPTPSCAEGCGHVRKGRSGSCRQGRNALMSILKNALL